MRQIHREGVVVRSGALERAPPTTWHLHTHTICMPDRVNILKLYQMSFSMNHIALKHFRPLSNVHPWRRSPWRNCSRHAGAVFGAAGASGAVPPHCLRKNVTPGLRCVVTPWRETLDAETRDAGITPPLSRMDGQHYQCACWELGTTWILYCWQNEKFQKSFSFIVPDSFTC